MPGYDNYITEDRRLAILRLLAEVEGTASESVIHKALRDTLYPHWTRTQAREDLDWLRQAGCVTHGWLNEDLLIATLSARGQDVARGDVKVEGIARPTRIK